jgi:transcriptional regulator with XRE-family HTH domain
LTQVELAERIGHDHTWVSKRLAGHVSLSVDDLLEFADALDVPATEFFRLADFPTNPAAA